MRLTGNYKFGKTHFSLESVKPYFVDKDKIKARISTLCSQFIPQNITALPLAINLLLISNELFFHRGCQYTTVKG